MAAKFVRFITFQKNPVTGDYIGFFRAAYALRRSQRAADNDADLLNQLLNWFDNNLEAPDKFSKSTKAHAHEKALSWFKPEAVEHIAKARMLLKLLEQYGVQSEMLLTAAPGIITYQDEHQIAAIPFKDKTF